MPELTTATGFAIFAQVYIDLLHWRVCGLDGVSLHTDFVWYLIS